MSNRNLFVMSVEQLHAYTVELASPFGIEIYVCEAGTLAVWFKMRDANDIPAELKTMVLADSYRNFIQLLILNNEDFL